MILFQNDNKYIYFFYSNLKNAVVPLITLMTNVIDFPAEQRQQDSREY